MTNVRDFAHAKARGEKISMVTAYDAWSARLIACSQVDAILVGDSAAMVMHGHPTTLPATIDMMAFHTAAVARVAPDKLIVADLPFLSYRQGIGTAMTAVGALMTSGAQAVKLEGVSGHEDVIRHVIGSGVPVLGHLGLTPQSVHQLGGFRVQGRSEADASQILNDAQALEALGCFAIVLECIPADVARHITAALAIPTIGIGAGAGTDGQILVLQDLWGVNACQPPRFVRHYLEGHQLLTDALNRYAADVKATRFPAPEESYA